MPPDPASVTHSLVECTDVRFAWRRQGPPVVSINRLRVARGERLLLRGPSGCGKSTLLNLIAGIGVADSGTVRVLGRDLGTLGGAARDRFRADHVGVIFQSFNLIPYLSALENVCLPCAFSTVRRSRCEAGHEAGTGPVSAARALLAALDLDVGELAQRRATELSVGQQQRVAAARALIGAPELIIADEPTSALDADRRSRFVDLLFRECARAGTTLIFVTHDAALAPSFDRCVEFEAINTPRAATGEVPHA